MLIILMNVIHGSKAGYSSFFCLITIIIIIIIIILIVILVDVVTTEDAMLSVYVMNSTGPIVNCPVAHCSLYTVSS